MLLSLLLSLVVSGADAATLRVGVGQPYTDVRDAVLAAVNGDVVLIDPGTYPVSRTINVAADLEIRGAGGIVQLDAQGRDIFNVTSGTVVLADMRLTPDGEHGVHIRGGAVTLSGLVIADNTNGGNFEGAAVLVDDATSVTITGCTFNNNSADYGQWDSGASGGCISAHQGVITVRDSSFERCTSKSGGAIATDDAVTLLVEDSRFTRDAATATAGVGGAIYARGALTVRRSVFDRNSATGALLGASAGAVYAGLQLTLEDNTFTDNRATSGGAVEIRAAQGASVVRNLFCANSATQSGGALYVGVDTTGWSALNNLFLENESGTGAALDMSSTNGPAGAVWPSGGVVRNNDFLGNDAGANGDVVSLDGARVTFENNLMMSNTGSALSDGSGPLNWTAWYLNNDDLSGRMYGSGDLRNVDPLLTAWSMDGDCTNDDLTPLPGSPLVNAGNPAVIDVDGSRSDIGAWGGPDAPITIDADQDGFGAAADCDDNNALVFPGAAELCNGADDDCDGDVDLPAPAGSPLWRPDEDGDGHGRRAGAVAACAAPPGYVASNDDCDDQRADAYPGAVELCDGIDNDCDELVDSADAGDLPSWYPDNDGDGFGRPVADPPQGCEAPAGTVANGLDCDDGAADRNPGVVEVCDGVDQDCDGVVDDDPPRGLVFYGDADGDGWGDALVTTTGCVVPAGYASVEGDCDDADRDVHPLAPEPCEPARDLNCDGASGTADNDGDGFGACEECDDFDSSRYPGAPDTWYDGLIADCDRASDFDRDRDGFDAPFAGGADCDDESATVYPGAVDVAGDGVDANCDGADTTSGPVGPVGGDDDEQVDVDASCGGCDASGRAPIGWLGLLLLAARRRR